MSPDLELPDEFAQKTNRSLKYFWMGFVIYTATYAFAFPADIYSNIFIIIELIGLVLFIPASFGLIRFDIKNFYLKIIYIFYCAWLLFTIKRGFSFSSSAIVNLIVNASSGLFLYIVPIALLFPRNLLFYKKIFDVIVVLAIFYLIFDIFYIRDLLSSDRTSLKSQAAVESLSQYLSFPIGFLLFTFNYHTKKRRLLAIGIFILSLLFVVIRARRGLIFMYGISMAFSFILYLFTTKKRILIIFVASIVIFFMAAYVYERFTNKSGVFGFLVERGTEDTRTPVEECFYDDMKKKDWIIGRGMAGEYFCPIVEEDADIKGYRAAIETGYLQIILNGGMISLGLFLLIAVPAVIYGIFFSKNMLSKAAGFWILLWMISLYPANVATFSMNYFLVWISIGICYSKTIRNIPEKMIRQFFEEHQTDSQKTINAIN